MGQLKHLIVPLGDDSISFCYYSNPIKKSGSKKLISKSLLTQTIEYADTHQLSINFLYPKQSLPEEYEKLVNTIPHIKLLTIDLINENSGENCLYIIDQNNREMIPQIAPSHTRNLILRLSRDELTDLNLIFDQLAGKFKRLNLHLLDTIAYTENEIALYQSQLELIAEKVTEQYKLGNPIELNFLSDRILLNQMHNCNAGLDHLTLAPNGQFYICPGFYYEDESQSVGDLKTGVNLKNRQLLDREHSPICSQCDAWHCKRCIYFNRKSTLEVNTPSYQQCVLSHLERNFSRKILSELKNTQGFHDFDNLTDIPEITYLDPLLKLQEEDIQRARGNTQTNQIQSDNQGESITIKDGSNTFQMPKLKQVKITPTLQKQTGQINKALRQLTQNELEELSVKELLIEIYKMQQAILNGINQ